MKFQIVAIIICILIQLSQQQSTELTCKSEQSVLCKLNNGTSACCPIADGTCCESGDFCCPRGNIYNSINQVVSSNINC
jgi:hypothetical protein